MIYEHRGCKYKLEPDQRGRYALSLFHELTQQFFFEKTVNDRPEATATIDHLIQEGFIKGG